MLWSRGLDTDLGALPGKLIELMSQEREFPMMMDLAQWLGERVYEIGFAFAVNADGATAVMRLTTFTGDPPEAVKAYRAALAKRSAGDRAGWTAGLSEVAKQWPDSRAGRRAALEAKGAPVAGPGSALILGGVGAWALLGRKMEEPPYDKPPTRHGFGDGDVMVPTLEEPKPTPPVDAVKPEAPKGELKEVPPGQL
jgi:hypothetical protein